MRDFTHQSGKLKGSAFGTGALEEPDDEEIFGRFCGEFSYEVVEPLDDHNSAPSDKHQEMQPRRIVNERKHQLKQGPHKDTGFLESMFTPPQPSDIARQPYQLPQVHLS